MKKFGWFILIFIICLSLGFRIIKDWHRYKLLAEEVADLKNRYALLLEEEKRLLVLKERGSRADVLEKEAREILGLQKKGEKTVLVITTSTIRMDSNLSFSSSSSLPLSSSSKNILDRIYQLWYNFYSRIKNYWLSKRK